MIKAVIFDLDGVLVTTDELHFSAWKQLADELNITGCTRADNARQRGVSRMASLKKLEKTDKKFSDEEKDSTCGKRKRYVCKIALKALINQCLTEYLTLLHILETMELETG